MEQEIKLTQEKIFELVGKKEFFKLGKKTTVCLLTLKNGFEVVTSSACVNPDDYDQELGEMISYKKALDRVRELQGYFAHNN